VEADTADRKDIFQLIGGKILNCSRKRGKKNVGLQVNDAFSKKKYNVGAQLSTYGDEKEILPYVRLIALKAIKEGAEIYLEYGKPYWLWRPNFDSLTASQAGRCKEHYEILDDEFYYPLPVAEDGTQNKKTKRSKK
jgi:hypothetical protein